MLTSLFGNRPSSEELQAASGEDTRHIEQEERKCFDQLLPTAAKSSFREPHTPPHHMSSGRHGILDSSEDDTDDDDDDDEIPRGLNLSPQNRKTRAPHCQENTPPLNRPPPSTQHASATATSTAHTCMGLDMDMEMEVDLGDSLSPSPFSAPYVPPSCDLLLRQACGGRAGVGTGATMTPPRTHAKPQHSPMTGSGIDHNRREEEEEEQRRIEEQKDLYTQYQISLSLLRNEQRKRQDSQQKEFEDSKKYHQQCEQFQQGLLMLAEQLGRDLSDLDRVRKDISTLRQKMQEVFYDQVDKQIKSGLLAKIDEAERNIEQRQEAIDKVYDFVLKHEDGEWVPVHQVATLLDSAVMRDLRRGQHSQVLFLDRIVSTLIDFEALRSICSTDLLERECMTFLHKHKIENYVTYMECNKHELFRNIISLDASMDVHSLRDIIAKITPTLGSVVAAGTFGNLTSAVNKKVSEIEKQISDVHKIMTEMGESKIIDEVCDNLRESLEGEDAQYLHSLQSKDILFLQRVLQGLEQIRAKQPTSEIDREVIQFLTATNESMVHVNDPVPSAGSAGAGAGVAHAATLAENTEDSAVDFLGPDLSEHTAAINKVIAEAPEEHRMSYQESLEKCLEVGDILKKIKAADDNDESKDRRNERRSVICKSTAFLQKRLDEMPGKTRRCLLSHIFQLVIDVAATRDLLTILELSIIPSSLCLGNVEKSRIFHDLVKKAAPVCTPKLHLASTHFDQSQRVRVVGLYAAQVGYCIELNTLVGLSAAGLENLLQGAWHWLVSCGSALSHAAKSSTADAVDTLCELCDAVKLFLDITGATLLNFLGGRLKQFLLQPLRQVLSVRTERKAKQLVSLLDQVPSSLPCLMDMHLLTPSSCSARVKKCEWEYRAMEWQKVTVTLKREFTDVKKTVGRAFNQLGTDAAGLQTFQENMGRLKQMPAMQNPDLRNKILFFLSDKALSICSDFKPGKGGVNEDEIVAPLATAFVWLLGSQKGMSDVFMAGLCSYCPFVYQLSLAVSEDDGVNKLELGYSKVELAPGNARLTPDEQAMATKKWRKRMTSLLAFYASLIVHGHESEQAGGPPLRHFTLQDAWLWLSRTVNFCARNKEDGLPTYIIWILYTFINIISPSLLRSQQYSGHYMHLLHMIRAEILPHVHSPPKEEWEVLEFRIAGLLSGVIN